MTVAFGQSDRSKIKMCKWEKEKSEKCSKKFTRRVKKFKIHEGFSEGNLQNDVGLVFLNKPVRFSCRCMQLTQKKCNTHCVWGNGHEQATLISFYFPARVRPICLPYSEELLKGHFHLTRIIYGHSEEVAKYRVKCIGWVSTKLRIVGWGLMTKLDEGPKILSSNVLSVETHVRKRTYCDQFHSRQYGILGGNRVKL